MRRFVFLLAAALAYIATGATVPPPAEFFADEEWTPDFVHASAEVLMQGSGIELHPTAAASVAYGRYTGDTLAVELRLLYAPNATGAPDGSGAVFGVSPGLVWHWWGFERLDPFFTLGADAMFAERHHFGEGSRRTAFGPHVGAGTFWHISETASIRLEARTALAVDGPCGTLFSLAAGLQFCW